MAEDTTTYEYSCGDKKGLEYYVIGDDIKNEFDFLTYKGSNNIPSKLDEMMTTLKKATDNVSAFKFENGSSVNDLQNVYTEISQDVVNIKSSLDLLHSAILTDIENVNAELDANFGYWIGRSLSRKESKKN